MVPPSSPTTNSPSLFPTLSDGFSHLDVELADLMRRLAHGVMEASDASGTDGIQSLDWWCGALALVSRASAQGHTGLVLPRPSGTQGPGSAPQDGLALINPEQPSQVPAFKAYVQRWRAATFGSAPMPAFVATTGLLIDDGSVWALPRVRKIEHRVAHRLAHRLLQPAGTVASSAEAWLQRWLPNGPSGPGDPSAHDNHDQHSACLQSLRGALTVITGGPGTGKTYTAARVIALLQRVRPAGHPWLRIGLAAPTGKAAARLRQALESAWQGLRVQEPHEAAFWADAWASVSPPMTVHALLAQRGSMARSRRVNMGAMGAMGAGLGEHPPAAAAAGHHLQRGALPLDVLLVDEASMLDLELMGELLEALPPQAKLILIGDRDQLSSVEAGAVMADICECLDGRPELVALRHSRRFNGPIGRLAIGVRKGDPAVLAAIAGQLQPDHARLVSEALGPQGWGPVLPMLRGLDGNNPADSQLAAVLAEMDRYRILTAVRKGPWGVDCLNTLIMNAMAAEGWLANTGDWRHGMLVMITRNDESTGLRNGDVGLIIRPGPGVAPQFAWAAGQGIQRIGVSRLPPFEPAYAITVHKSQGSEFDRVAMILPEQDAPVISREWLYTGLTRARQDVSWFGVTPALPSTAGSRRTVRMSGLQACLTAALQDHPGHAGHGGSQRR